MKSIFEQFEVTPYVVRLNHYYGTTLPERWRVEVAIVVENRTLWNKVFNEEDREVFTQEIVNTTDFTLAMKYYKATRRVAAINAAAIALGGKGVDLFDIRPAAIRKIVKGVNRE